MSGLVILAGFFDFVLGKTIGWVANWAKDSAIASLSSPARKLEKKLKTATAQWKSCLPEDLRKSDFDPQVFWKPELAIDRENVFERELAARLWNRDVPSPDEFFRVLKNRYERLRKDANSLGRHPPAFFAEQNSARAPARLKNLAERLHDACVSFPPLRDPATSKRLQRIQASNERMEASLLQISRSLSQLSGETEKPLTLVENATNKYLRVARGKLIRKKLIPRSATRIVLERFSEGAEDLIVTGTAGGGKTGCIVELVEKLREAQVAVLALRLDRYGAVSTAKCLGAKAGFSESPAVVLAAASSGGDVVLILDQLDAISTVSGRTTGLFDAVEDLLNEVHELRKAVDIRVVLVCRGFDWKHDFRLKHLLGEHSDVEVQIFSADEVRHLLTSASFDPSLFSPQQLELLQLPQNLSLFLDAGFNPTNKPEFSSAAAIFDRYWKANRQAVLERAKSDFWMKTIDIVVSEMTQTQELSVRREKLDIINSDFLEQMCSAGVLTFDEQRYGFGHESFFDYCYARTFINQEGTLVEQLLSGEQHLFRRSQTRQVLTYLRDQDFTRYLEELQTILGEPRVRLHIKDLAFAVLANVDSPLEQEWLLWQPLIQPMLDAFGNDAPGTADKLIRLSWRHLFLSTTWFKFLAKKGVVADWLKRAKLTQVTVRWVRIHVRQSQDIVARILEPYMNCQDDWPARLRSIVVWSDQTNRQFFELTLRLIDNGVLDKARGPVAENSTFWSLFYVLGKERPSWVPEVIAHRLDRRLAVLAKNGVSLDADSLSENDQFAETPIREAAENAPDEFVQHVLPVILKISAQAVLPDNKPPKRDSVWPGLFKGKSFSVASTCLKYLAKALAKLASSGKDLRHLIDDLRPRDTFIANYLLQVLFAAGSERYAGEAAKMLSAESWRFDCGFHGSRNWTSIELIRAIASKCEKDACAKLETAILGYAPERDPSARGRASFSLLSAIPPSLRSDTGRRYFEQRERKFEKPAKAPQAIRLRAVPSPIEKDAAEKMTDAQWLGAIKKHSRSTQLARTLETLVLREPARFANLARKFPPNTNGIFWERVLDGLRKANIPIEELRSVCQKIFSHARTACGISLAKALGSFGSSLTDEDVNILSWLAVETPETIPPATEHLYEHGMNTTRGYAAEVIGALIHKDPCLIPKFQGALERMVADPSPVVRTCVARALEAVAFHDSGLALSLFQHLDPKEELLVTLPIFDLLKALLREHFEDVRPTLEQMLRSTAPVPAYHGACLVSLAALRHENARDLVHEATCNRDQRKGVAEVAAANIAAKEHQEWCEAHLIEFFCDTDEEVRKEAALCFRNLKERELEEYDSLIRSFLTSEACRDDSFSILLLLKHSSYDVPEIACLVCEKLIDSCHFSALRPEARMLTNLVFQIYQNHQDDEWTKRALDLVDRLCLEGVSDARRELDAMER